jgi:hypothetical protein
MEQEKHIEAPKPEGIEEDTRADSDKQDVAPQPMPVSRKNIVPTWVLITICVTLLVFGGCFAYFSRRESTKNDNAAIQTDQGQKMNDKKSDNTTVVVDQELERFTTPTTGETWLVAPKKVDKLGFFTADNEEYSAYYEVGARNGSTIYVVEASADLASTYLMFEKATNGSVSWVAKPSKTITYDNNMLDSYKDHLATGVFYDEIIGYDSLSFPRNGIVVGTEQKLFLKSLDLGRLITEESNDSKEVTLKRVGESNIIKSERTYDDTKLTNISFFLDTPAHTRITLSYEPFSASVNDIMWNRGDTKGSGSFKPIAKGCSLSSASVTRSDSLTESDFISAGKTKTGELVYELVDNNYKLLTKTYDEYKDFYAYDVTQTILSKDNFVNGHALIFVKDKDNTWLVYVNDTLAPVGGCAKPVVYLYPTQETEVAIRVGAQVKISEPQYDPVKGWNVIASPNGELRVAGNTYSSLFWEGPGYGPYPYLNGRGIVVKTQDAIQTIKSHLLAQGFRDNEINDFLNYWSDKMPKKPYTRLTWLTTEEMNALAPLDTNPNPDTVIRAFLDYEGLDEYVALTPQVFTAPERRGFVLVEWGGLSPYKLY